MQVSKWFKLVNIFMMLSYLFTANAYATAQSRFLVDPYLPTQGIDDGTFEMQATEYFGPLSQDRDLTEKAQKLLDEAFDLMKLTYPRWLSNKARPQIAVLADAETFNVSAVASQEGEFRYTFVSVSEDFVRSSYPHDGKLGILIHELAHAFLFHSSVDGIVAILDKNGQEVQAPNFHLYLRLKRLVGEARPELFPISGTFSSVLQSFAYDQQEKSADCKSLDSILTITNDRARAAYRDQSGTFEFSPKDLEAMRHENAKLEDAFLKCAAGYEDLEPFTLSKEERGLLVDAHITPKLLPEELTATQFWDVAKRTARFVHDVERLPSSGLIFYSQEDQADQVAVSVLVDNRRNAIAFRETLNWTVISEGRDSAICRPGATQGLLNDSHHNYCWRIDQLLRWEKSGPKIPGLE